MIYIRTVSIRPSERVPSRLRSRVRFRDAGGATLRVRLSIPQQYDLRQAFLLGVLLPLAGLSAIVVLVTTSWAERSLEARLHGEIELISRAVAPDIGRILVDRDRERKIRRSLDSLFEIERIYGAAVYDERGDLVLAAGTADQDLRSSQAASHVVLTGEDEGSYRSVDGRNVYAYFTPLLDSGGRIHGLLQITRDRQEIDASLAELRTLAWSVWAVAGISAVLATLLLHRRMVGHPVRTLLDRMNALSAGERHVTYDAQAPREFAQIGAGFNAMVESIRGAEDALREQQLRERDLERRLRESEKIATVGRVAQGLAHELGSPLSVVDGRVRRMENSDGSRYFGEALRDIRRQLERMTNIVRQLLSYGWMENDRHVEVELFELLERMIHEVVDDDCRIELDPESDQAVVHGDPLRLELALSNLIANAVRHARHAVIVGAYRTRQGICIRVSDDGPGVPPEDRSDIFQPFFTRQSSGEGTGLGLAIAANVMREHEGQIRYEDAAGGGAQLVLIFPSTTHDPSVPDGPSCHSIGATK